MRTKLSSKGQIVLPAEFRTADGLVPGQAFEIERIGEGEYRIKKAAPETLGIATWLAQCPEKGWFVPLESESTDTITGKL